jgi:hypothetical protein
MWWRADRSHRAASPGTAQPEPGTGRAGQADVELALAGHELADRLEQVLAGWLTRRALALLAGTERSRSTGVSAAPAIVGAGASPDRQRIARAAEAAAERTVDRLRQLADTDVDEQRTTPLTLLREEVSGELTELLCAARVAPPASSGARLRGGDPFGLAPTRWQQVDSDAGVLALVWGAAKVRAHRARHGASGKAGASP